MSSEGTVRIPLVLLVLLNGFVFLKRGMNLSNLSSFPARLLKSFLECSIYYKEKFE